MPLVQFFVGFGLCLFSYGTAREQVYIKLRALAEFLRVRCIHKSSTLRCLLATYSNLYEVTNEKLVICSKHLLFLFPLSVPIFHSCFLELYLLYTIGPPNSPYTHPCTHTHAPTQRAHTLVLILGLKRMANLLSGYPDTNIYGYPTDSDIIKLVLLATYIF